MKKYDYMDASPEQKGQLIDEIASKYDLRDKAQTVQAMAHIQAELGATQEELTSLGSLMDVNPRTLRNWKKEYEDLYLESFEKFTPEPEIAEINVDLEEDAMEAVYNNLLSRLQNPKTATKDLAQILQYFGISGQELRAYASSRNRSLRGFYRDAEKALVPEQDTANLVRSLISESNFLYQGTPKTQGNTENYLSIDMDNSIVRLEAQTMGLLLMGLWNGNISPQFTEMAQTLRLLKYADGHEVSKNSYKEFDLMDGQPKKLKPMSTKMEQDLIEVFGKEEGTEIYQKMLNAKDYVDIKTKVKLPKYESVEKDYIKTLKVFSKLEDMPFEVLLAQLDAQDEDYNKKYNEFIKEEN